MTIEKKYESSGYPLAEVDQAELRADYRDKGVVRAARDAGVDAKTFLRGMAGAGLYPSSLAKLTAYAIARRSA